MDDDLGHCQEVSVKQRILFYGPYFIIRDRHLYISMLSLHMQMIQWMDIYSVQK